MTPTHYRSKPGAGECLFGENSLHNYDSAWEVKNPMSTDGQVQDWDLATRLWEYALTDRLLGRPGKSIRSGNTVGTGADPDPDGDVDMMAAAVETIDEQEMPLIENPLLMSEPGLNPTKEREKTIEIAMESWGAPAFWLGRTGVLSA